MHAHTHTQTHTHTCIHTHTHTHTHTCIGDQQSAFHDHSCQRSASRVGHPWGRSSSSRGSGVLGLGLLLQLGLGAGVPPKLGIAWSDKQRNNASQPPQGVGADTNLFRIEHSLVKRAKKQCTRPPKIARAGFSPELRS